MLTRPKALLFDLGSVLIDVDFDRSLRAWQPVSRLSLQQLRASFTVDAHYERHERGEIGAAEYFDHLARLLQLDAPHDRILAGWNAVFAGEIADTVALVHAVRSQVPCHVFSNTNATHQAAYSALYPDLFDGFGQVFTSHEIGRRKPERRAFEHIVTTLGVAPAEILFFDDLAANVEGAIAAGLRAVQVRSPEDVRSGLRAAGCLS